MHKSHGQHYLASGGGATQQSPVGSQRLSEQKDAGVSNLSTFWWVSLGQEQQVTKQLQQALRPPNGCDMRFSSARSAVHHRVVGLYVRLLCRAFTKALGGCSDSMG